MLFDQFPRYGDDSIQRWEFVCAYVFDEGKLYVKEAFVVWF